jgi:diguanylate cyclase (GGDEF)-like protein
VIDVHFHCLPGIDDGPRDWDEAAALCREAARQGSEVLGFIPVCTIVTASIIFALGRHLNQKITEIINQREEITALYEELSATKEELSGQNRQLTEYNRVMQENEERLNYLAYFDTLTELPNRKMIINRLELLMNLPLQNRMKFAVAFIDLDNFKRINDSLGHHFGDTLLQAVVSRLRTVVRADDMLGRLGGDEIALIIQHPLKDEELFEYAENLRTVLLKPSTNAGAELDVSASLGISTYPQDGENSEELLKCADTAMYKAKDSGKNAFQFFCREMKDEILRKIAFEKLLQTAISNNEIYLVFQPQFNSFTKQLRGFEALVRWNSPELGPIGPDKFIPAAEEMGYIITLGEWILKSACELFKQFLNENKADVILSVNISAVQIMEPSFADRVKRVLKETGFDGKHLEFEVTESVFITSMDYVVKVLDDLKRMGIHIALDDFGTGYSSLNYIQQLPIDILKIDKSFIDSINHEEDKKQIVGNIISLVHQLGISVVAEGVENKIQMDYLLDHDCDYLQGFLLGKPLCEIELNNFIQQLKYGNNLL